MLSVFRRLLGIAEPADVWLSEQSVSERCVMRLWEWERIGSKVIAK